MKNKNKFEAIFAVVNQGFSETVMLAAKSAGARGGTIINTRGGSNSGAEKNYGVIITPDTELVIMVVDVNIKEDVIKAVYEKAGIETKAMGIIWSVPADNVVGIKPSPVIDKSGKN